MKKKNITINELAAIIQKGFAKTNVLIILKKDLKNILLKNNR